MNTVTLEQRHILEAHTRRIRRVNSPLAQMLHKVRTSLPTLKSSLTIVAYLFIFAICFQATRNDFESKSAAYLSASNKGTAITQKDTSSSVTPKPSSAVVSPDTGEAVTSLPATDQPSPSSPSQAQQFTATGYAYGQCTWYVSKRRPIPQNWGNARDWLARSKAAGFTTGKNARPGAIGQTPVGRYGHVVYVEKVENGQVYVSEMNYVGWNRMTYRWAPESEFSYIY